MRENRTSGSIGGRWPDATQGEEEEHAPGRGNPTGLSPSDLPATSNQRPTSLVSPSEPAQTAADRWIEDKASAQTMAAVA